MLVKQTITTIIIGILMNFKSLGIRKNCDYSIITITIVTHGMKQKMSKIVIFGS